MLPLGNCYRFWFSGVTERMLFWWENRLLLAAVNIMTNLVFAPAFYVFCSFTHCV